ncbi:MAG: hypothetical protein Q8O30_10830 [Candidatus Omnitrophota bacterium]|nr:hypothetical protein [Candidatus Omnitrophota bacterium]
MKYSTCLVIFLLCFFCFALNCFAYNIESYSERFPNQANSIFNLVFCSINYTNKENFSKDIEVLIQRLSKTKPFDEINTTGFWYINTSKEEEGIIFKRTQGFPPLKVRSDFLDDVSTYLNSNYKLIIIDASGLVSCAELSSADKLSLIILGKARYKDEDSFAKGFLHELGHSLGLRDECVDCAQLSLAGPPNCAATKEEAQKWWGDLVGKVARVNYIRGCCGNKDYIRPVIASLMNDADKAEDFGPVNERYLKNILEGLW